MAWGCAEDLATRMDYASTKEDLVPYLLIHPEPEPLLLAQIFKVDVENPYSALLSQCLLT
jgi:hypothetical protein